jgi:hypothetical protein
VPRGGERRQEPPVVVVDARGAQGQGTVDDAAVGVGEQGVFADPRGEGALGETAHVDTVELEPEAERDVTHQHAVAEAAHPAEVGVELEFQRAPEDVDGRFGLDRVEPGEALQRGLDLLGGAHLLLGPGGARGLGAEEFADEVLGPGDEPGPARGRGPCRVVAEGACEIGDERLQRGGGVERAPDALGVRVAFGDGLLERELCRQRARVAGQAGIPLGGAPHDARLAGDPFPP